MAVFLIIAAIVIGVIALILVIAGIYFLAQGLRPVTVSGGGGNQSQATPSETIFTIIKNAIQKAIAALLGANSTPQQKSIGGGILCIFVGILLVLGSIALGAGAVLAATPGNGDPTDSPSATTSASPTN